LSGAKKPKPVALAPPAEVAYIASIEWAGALALCSETISKDDLKARWEGAEGVKWRAELKIFSPDILQQLVTLVRARLAIIKAAEAEA
jgi:hypothetical protein